MKQYQSDFKRSKPIESMAETLKKYCDKHKRPTGNLVHLAYRMGVAEAIVKQFKTFFARESSKKFSYWHVGCSNTGKTSFSKILKQIFHCGTLKMSKGGWSIITEDPYWTEQIVVSDESNEETFFKKDNLANMKSFMEGDGYLCDEKGVQPYTVFTGACLYMCSNELPSVSKLKNNDWDGICYRTNFYMASKEMIHKDTGKFPMSATVYAWILYDMLV